MTDALPDIIAKDLAVLFCGINPSLQAAADGHHFSGRSNRFWRVLHLAGFTPEEMAPKDDGLLLRHGCGLTAVVGRATARADQLSRQDFTAAAGQFERKLAQYTPRFVAFLGKPAYLALTGHRDITWGRQPARIATSEVWVLPNPSGRNRSFSLDRLVEAYRDLLAASHGSPLGA